MYSYEDRTRAVELYIKLGKRVRPTIRQLGCLGQACSQFDQVSVFHALRHRVARKAAQGIAYRHHALDRFGAAEFEADAHLIQVFQQPRIRDLDDLQNLAARPIDRQESEQLRLGRHPLIAEG